MKRALIIAAHPDDEVLGCGGTIAKYVPKGVKFSVLFIGEGSSCRFKDIHQPEVKNAISERTQFAKTALELLGVSDIRFNDLPCGRLDQVPILEINKIIEDEINRFNPDTVFTHAQNDVNNDHQIVYKSTLMATRPNTKNFVPRLLSYEVLSSSEWSFSNAFAPTYFEILEESHLDAKWRALSCYESEIRDYPFPRSAEGLRALSMIRGMQAGASYAEAFTSIREVAP